MSNAWVKESQWKDTASFVARFLVDEHRIPKMSEVSDALGFAKSTVQRHYLIMVDRGMLEMVGKGQGYKALDVDVELGDVWNLSAQKEGDA